MSYQQPPTKKSNTGLWLGGAAILLVALIAVVVLLLNRPSAPAAPAAAVIVSAETATVAPPTATPIAVNTHTPESTETPTSTPMPELGTSNLFIEYILDASGSMSETLSDGSPKIEVAQRVLTEHMRSFRPETNIGLRVYGHRLPYQQTDESCQDIELIAPPEKGQMERIASWLQDFTVQGMTPLAASLEQAKDDFIFDASRINSIVMLSDGIETCSGDPCQLVEDLKAEGINFTIHVIGLDVDDPTRQQLTCIAQAGGGSYHDTRSQQELNAALGAVKTDVTQGEIVVPPGVNTPTPIPTATPTTEVWLPDPSDVFVNPLDGATYMRIPAGEFLMGSSDSDPNAENDEKPQHVVYLDEYWMMRTEVSVAQYRRCLEAGACPAPPSYSNCTGPEALGPDYPVTCSTFDGAQSYCRWAGSRLPTEAEWEKAARGTDGRLYPWGNERPDCTFAVYVGQACGVSSVAEVGSKPRDMSPYGVMDMAGNASELVADLYGPIYYSRSPERNPSGPSISEADTFYAIEGIFVRRGSSRGADGSVWPRAAARAWGEGMLASHAFRCVRSP